MRIGIDARSLSMPLTGIGRYTREICQRLAMRGHEIVLYSHAPIPQENALSQGNIRYRIARVGNRFLGLLWFQFMLSFRVRRDGLDLFWGPAHKLPFFLPPSLARVLTIHDLVWRFAGNTMPRTRQLSEWILMPQAIARADAVVTVSHSTAAALLSLYPDLAGRIEVIYPGTIRLQPRADCRPPMLEAMARPYFLFVGTLEPRKNLPRLLRAFARLKHKEQSDIALILAGGAGWGDVALDETIRQEGLTGDVFVTGYVSDMELAELYAKALFLAMPSTYEGFGLPIIEAMSFGVPVLTSSVSSMPEVAGSAALLVDPEDPESIYAGLKRMIMDTALRESLAKNCLLNVQRFDWERTTDQLESLFKKVLS